MKYCGCPTEHQDRERVNRRNAGTAFPSRVRRLGGVPLIHRAAMETMTRFSICSSGSGGLGVGFIVLGIGTAFHAIAVLPVTLPLPLPCFLHESDLSQFEYAGVTVFIGL